MQFLVLEMNVPFHTPILRLRAALTAIANYVLPL